MPWNEGPTASFFTSRSIITRPSGVICGVTARLNTADLKLTVVPPLDADVKYGISVPCSIVAFCLSAVMTRGLETILPRLSASSACNSKAIKLPLPILSSVNAREAVGLAPATGRLMLGISLTLTAVFVPVAILVEGPSVLETPRLVLLRLYPPRPPKRNPSCLLHLSSAITMRASIMT